MGDPRPTERRLRRGGLVVAATLLLAACGSTPTPTPTPVPTPSSTPAPTPTPTPVPIASARAINEELLHRRLTVLVVGEDQSALREARGYLNTNTDTLMVVSLSANQAELTMLSVPRDTVDVPLGDGTIYSGKVNAIAGTLGLPALQATVGALLGIPIDAYLKIDMDDLVTLVDAVGGVDVEVQTRLYEARFGLDLQPGPAHLDGELALAYCRSRVDSDYARAGRQQQVVLDVARRLVDPTAELSFPELLASFSRLETNLDLAEIPTYVALARRSADAAVVATVLAPPRFAFFAGEEPGTLRGWVMIPNVAEMRAYAQQLIGE